MLTGLGLLEDFCFEGGWILLPMFLSLRLLFRHPLASRLPQFIPSSEQDPVPLGLVLLIH